MNKCKLVSSEHCLSDVSTMNIIYVNSDELPTQCQPAFSEVQTICNSIPEVKFHCINYQQLDRSDSEENNPFYTADVVVVDVTVQNQQHLLSYQLGIRESYGLNRSTSIVLYNRDSNAAAPFPAKVFSRYTSAVYYMREDAQCIVDSISFPLVNSNWQDFMETEPCTLGSKIQNLLQHLKDHIKTNMKVKFLSDLSKAKGSHTGENLKKILHNMRLKLHDKRLISADTVHNILLAFREIQDYSAMIELVNDLNLIPEWRDICTPYIDHLYAFALNRRNQKGDRQLAEEFVTSALKKKDHQFLEMFCLFGRIYKDKFIDSACSNMDFLDNAIHWYRKGFEIQEGAYAGINLATLLMIKGNTFSSSPELQSIFVLLNNVIGQKGNLESQKNYWDVATFFEINVLANDFSRAILAAACMFNLKPPNWYLKSTISNIQLVNKLLQKKGTEKTPEEIIFDFWMDYFVEASTEKEPSFSRLPILIMDSSNSYIPSYVTLNDSSEEKSVAISNLCIETLRGKCINTHEFIYNIDSLKTISFYKEEQCSLYFYVHKNSTDIQAIFPSIRHSKIFHQLVLEMVK